MQISPKLHFVKRKRRRNSVVSADAALPITAVPLPLPLDSNVAGYEAKCAKQVLSNCMTLLVFVIGAVPAFNPVRDSLSTG